MQDMIELANRNSQGKRDMHEYMHDICRKYARMRDWWSRCNWLLIKQNQVKGAKSGDRPMKSLRLRSGNGRRTQVSHRTRRAPQLGRPPVFWLRFRPFAPSSISSISVPTTLLRQHFGAICNVEAQEQQLSYTYSVSSFQLRSDPNTSISHGQR